MQLPKSEQLNIASLSRLFDNKAECYKLFWFQAILNHVCKGQQEIRFEELIDDMIANAWYMVTEYHLNLGPRDKLEEAVNYISSVTAMLPNVKQQEIRNWLQSSTDSAVTRYKRTLTLNVPFRLQAPENISIDHFVPWSYVAHDEFWNLHPTTRAINSSKSNHLPEWELYFPRFAGLEYLSYQMIWKYEAVRNEFKKCAREHLNNPEIEHRLYREGLGAEEFTQQLREVVYPIYLSAKTCGFSSWEYELGEHEQGVHEPGLRSVSGDLLCPVNGCAFPEDGETLFKVAERE